MIIPRPCSPPLNHQSLQEMKSKNKAKQQQLHLASETESRNRELKDEAAFQLSYDDLLKNKGKESKSNLSTVKKVQYTKGGPQDVIRIRLKKSRQARLEWNRRRTMTKSSGVAAADEDGESMDYECDDVDGPPTEEEQDDATEGAEMDQHMDYDSTVDAEDLDCDVDSIDDTESITRFSAYGGDMEEEQDDICQDDCEPTGYESSYNASVASDESDNDNNEVDQESHDGEGAIERDAEWKAVNRMEARRWKDSKVKKQAFATVHDTRSVLEHVLLRLQEKHTDILFTKDRIDFTCVRSTNDNDRSIADIQIGNLTK